MTNKDFIIGDVLGFGWRVMKGNIGFFAVLILIAITISVVPEILRALAHVSPFSSPVVIMFGFILHVVSQVVNFVIGIGFVKVALSFCDQVKPTVATLFDVWDCFWRYVGVSILYGLIVFAGMLLLIIPGIIWAVKFQYGFYFVVDKGLGPVAALKASSRTTQGIKFKLFGFGLLCGLINLLGLICLIVGMFATYPMVLVAMALVYRHLIVQTPELAEFGVIITSPEPQPQDERIDQARHEPEQSEPNE
jgi:uncharacterized membrane protein